MRPVSLALLVHFTLKEVLMCALHLVYWHERASRCIELWAQGSLAGDLSVCLR